MLSPGIVVARATRERVVTTAGEWVLAWHDEFDGHDLDLTKWDVDPGQSPYSHFSPFSPLNPFSPHGTAPGERGAAWAREQVPASAHAPVQVRVEGGMLKLRVLAPPGPGGFTTTAARISTRRRDGRALFAQCHGRFVFRARGPSGTGLAPWLGLLPVQGPAAPGGIDVMQVQGDRPHEVLSGLQYGCGVPGPTLQAQVHALPLGSTAADWHVYAVEWEPGEIRFFVDEVLTSTHRFWWSSRRGPDGLATPAGRLADLDPWPAPFDQPFCIGMQVAACGAPAVAPHAAGPIAGELVVDYVRVYRKVGGYGPVKPRGRGRFPWHGLR